MSRLLIFIVSIIAFASCKRGDQQIISLKNLSPENIYFLISDNKVLKNANELAKVRPITSNPFSEIKVEYAEKEQAESIRHNLYRYRIEVDSAGTILTSESAGIFVNAISIQNIIKDRYNGQLNVFVITETDLLKHSDQEVIDKKLCRHFKAIMAENIKENTLTLEYR
ncbi:MAG: hypothetical protein WKF87_15375 [Chryseolinea sp.]